MTDRIVPVKTYVKTDGTAVSAHGRQITSVTPPEHEMTASLRDGTLGLADPLPSREVLGISIPLAGHGGASVPLVLPEYIPAGTDLSGLDLRGADFGGMNLEQVDLSGTDLRGVNFTGAELRSVDLRGADVRGANFFCVNSYSLIADELNVNGANLNGASLRFSPIWNTVDGETTENNPPPVLKNILKADLSQASIYYADLSGQDLRGWDTTVKGPKEFMKVNLSGAKLNGANISRMAFEECSFAGADLSDVNVNGVYWSQVDAVGMNATGALFAGAYFTECDMTGADFTGIQFGIGTVLHSDFTNTNFTDANFNGQYITQIKCSDFQGANFTNADLGQTSFAYQGDDNIPSRDRATNLIGATWTGAKTEHMIVGTGNYYTATDPDGLDVATPWKAATYEKYTLDEAAERLGVDRDTLAVVVWGEMLEMRHNKTTKVITDTAELDNAHIPEWSMQNCEL